MLTARWLRLFPQPITNFGTDGPAPGGGVSHDFVFIISGQAGTVATNLTATPGRYSDLENLTDAARKIELFQVSDTIIEGRIVGDGNPATDDQYVAFRIMLVDANTPSAAHHGLSVFCNRPRRFGIIRRFFDEQVFLRIFERRFAQSADDDHCYRW